MTKKIYRITFDEYGEFPGYDEYIKISESEENMLNWLRDNDVLRSFTLTPIEELCDIKDFDKN